MKKMLAVALIVVAWVFMLSASSVMAQGETGDCFGNFDCDQDVDAIDVANFLSSFGRSQFFNPCPLCQDSLCPCSSTAPKTGQTTTYATGDDGDLEKGLIWPNPRFTDNGDGTVTDNLTNLIWLKEANCYGTRSWSQALSACNSLADGEDCGTGGTFLLSDGSSAGDWRLANIKELQSLIDFENAGPALPAGHPFDNVQTFFNNYWSSSTGAINPTYAWYMGMNYGNLDGASKVNLYSVWPVRDPL